MSGAFVMMMLLVQASEPPRDPCGDPMMVSQAYSAVFGTVRDVGDSVTIVVDLDEQPTGSFSVPLCSRNGCIVRLVNLLPPNISTTGALGKEHLAGLCKGKRVELLVSPYQDIPGVLNAMAHTEN